jgi:cullin-4
MASCKVRGHLIKTCSFVNVNLYTLDKDVFRIFFMRALAKRLLLQRSASDDFEKGFLAKLGRGTAILTPSRQRSIDLLTFDLITDFDPEFEKGLKMFEDLTISRSLITDFHDKYPEDVKFSAYVFQPSNWPTYAATKLTLPAELQSSIDHFGDFYLKVHSNRRLTWIHSLGTVSLAARFPKGDKELIVSLYQALVLLAFNDGVDRLKFKEMRDRVDLSTTRPILSAQNIWLLTAAALL